MQRMQRTVTSFTHGVRAAAVTLGGHFVAAWDPPLAVRCTRTRPSRGGEECLRRDAADAQDRHRRDRCGPARRMPQKKNGAARAAPGEKSRALQEAFGIA
jgi:hypothetical protein